MNKLFMKLISTLFISNYLVFIILNLNMLICGYSLYEYYRYIIFNLWFILFLLGVYCLIKVGYHLDKRCYYES